MKNFRTLPLLFLALSLTFVACDDDDDKSSPAAASSNTVNNSAMSIAEIAIADTTNTFDSLVVALSQTGLVPTFQNAGTYTVFAPTNMAFANLIAGNMNWNRISDIDNTALSDILKYHVLGSVVRSTQLTDDTYGTTLNSKGANGEATVLEIDVTGGAKINNSANIIGTDVDASNGIVHVIDAVITPRNIVELAQNDERFSILVSALSLFGDTLLGPLGTPGSFTVFAPTDAAFTSLLNSNSNWNSLTDIPRSALFNILRYHVIAGQNKQASNLSQGEMLPAFNGDTLVVDLSNGPQLQTGDMSQGPVNIIVTDVQGTNGVIHAVEEVLLP